VLTLNRRIRTDFRHTASRGVRCFLPQEPICVAMTHARGSRHFRLHAHIGVSRTPHDGSRHRTRGARYANPPCFTTSLAAPLCLSQCRHCVNRHCGSRIQDQPARGHQARHALVSTLRSARQPLFQHRRYACMPPDWYHQRRSWEERSAAFNKHAIDLLAEVACKATARAGRRSRTSTRSCSTLSPALPCRASMHY